MTFARLLWRNLLYHSRGNFAVFLGVALGTVKSQPGRPREWALTFRHNFGG